VKEDMKIFKTFTEFCAHSDGSLCSYIFCKTCRDTFEYGQSWPNDKIKRSIGILRGEFLECGTEELLPHIAQIFKAAIKTLEEK
jgi:hypothetical protein